MAGEVFAAGHAERGNDLPVLLSTSKAERVDGGFRFTGHKMFGSLTPVWTRSACTPCGPTPTADPKIVHAFLPRDTTATASSRPGTRWACAPPAATTRCSTAPSCPTSTSRGSCRPARRRPVRARHLRLGADGLRATSIAAIAQRAIDLAVAGGSRARPRSRSAGRWPTTRRSSTRSRRWRWRSRRSTPHLDQVAEDWSNGVDHGGDVAGEDRLGQVPRRRGRAGGSSTGRWRSPAARGMFRAQRTGAAVPRRALRRLPPGEHLPASTRSSARPRSASTSASSRAGGESPRFPGSLSAAQAGAQSASAGPSGPSIRRLVPVGAFLHAAHRLHLPVPGAVRLRLQHVVGTRRSPPARNPNMPAGDSENMRRVMGEQVEAPPLTPEPGDIWPGPLPPEPTLQDLEQQGEPSRSPSGRCRARREFQDQQPPNLPPPPATRGSSTPPGSNQPGLAPLPAPTPPRGRPTRRRPRATRPGRSYQRSRARQSPAAAPAATRPPRRRAAVPQSSCPMAMAPARSYIRTAGSRLSPHHAESPWPMPKHR